MEGAGFRGPQCLVYDESSPRQRQNVYGSYDLCKTGKLQVL